MLFTCFAECLGFSESIFLQQVGDLLLYPQYPSLLGRSSVYLSECLGQASRVSSSLTEGWDSLYKGWEGLTQTLYSAAKNLKRSHRTEVIKRSRARNGFIRHL